MPISWEASSNPAMHGFLKLMDAQGKGFDVHGTIMKDKAVAPHISVYELGKTDRILSAYGSWNGAGKLTFPGDKMVAIMTQTNLKEAVLRGFIGAINNKYLEFFPLAAQQAVASVFKLDDSVFPDLPKKG
jgi:hypothetical protein